jgi:hypothetical protein
MRDGDAALLIQRLAYPVGAIGVKGRTYSAIPQRIEKHR